MKVLAGIVLYHPDIVRLQENMDAVCGQVDEVLLINNGSDDERMHAIIGEYGNATIIDNDDNLGIAAALGQIMRYAVDHQYNWVLTLDQDSICMPELVARYSQYVDLERIGILTCNIVDRNFTEEKMRVEESCTDVSKCITAGAFMCVAAYRQTDGYNDRLFIDAVDFDICYNMRQHGYRIVQIGYDGILHEVGHGRNVRILWRKFISYNHPPFRQYYRARNARYLVLKYPCEYSRARAWCAEIVEELIILFYEDQKFEKIRNRWRGLRDSRKLIN